jgi:hypothetical protein
LEYKGKSYPVTKIGISSISLLSGHAFYNRNKLSSVSIPNTVKSISTPLCRKRAWLVYIFLVEETERD